MREKLYIFLIACLLIPTTLHAEGAPHEIQKFNVTCPSRSLCPQVDSAYRLCKKKQSSSACNEFVEKLKKLLPSYDCQRSFDHEDGINYTVPAAWLCDEQLTEQYGQQNIAFGFEAYVGLLSKLKSKEAQALFGSKGLRDALDGAVAEEFVDKSLQVERSLKKSK